MLTDAQRPKAQLAAAKLLDEVVIPDGLARATIWLPLRDALPLPQGKGLLLGDELPELAGQPIFVEGDNGEPIPIPDSEGHAPVEVRIWRIDDTAARDSGFAAAKACVLSGLVHQKWDIPKELETVTSTRVVIQVTFLVQKIEDNYFQGAILEQGLEFVQRLQTAYHMVFKGPPVELLTQEQLPTLVPIVVSPGPPEPLHPGNVMMLAPIPIASTVERFETSHLTPTKLLSQQDLQKVMMATGGLPAQPGLIAHQFRTDARIQLHRYGNYRQSVIATAASAESFLSTMYQMLLWEEGVTPAAAAALLSQVESILKRTKREMQTRLRGPWDENLPGPLADWNEDVLKVRNAIVHAGHTATRAEALRALQSLNNFVSMFADRFAIRAIWRRSPKTAILAVPRESLEQRGAWCDELQQLSDDHYADWWFGFLTWQRQMESRLQM